jgi:hypothetical protein
VLKTETTHGSINRPLAVIDDGLNVQAHFQTLATINGSKPKLLEQVRQDVSTTMIYTYVLNRAEKASSAPLIACDMAPMEGWSAGQR